MANNDMMRLAEDLGKLDKLRRQTRNSIILAGAIVLIMVVILWKLMRPDCYVSTPLYYSAFFIFASITGAMPITIEKVRRRYKKLYNAVIVRASLERYFEIDEFNSDYGVPKAAIDATGMIRTGNCYKTDDLIKGKYKDISFMQSDVLMEDRASFSQFIKSKPITYFKGRWMIFEFNKRFKCDLMIYEKAFMFTGKKHTLAFGSGVEKVEFENAQFNSHFDAYTNNQSEAFYVMTPQLMEAIERLRESTSGALLLCFRNNVLHVGVNSGRWAFEPPIFSAIDVASVSVKIDSDIKLITAFVDGLKLDEKIYSID